MARRCHAASDAEGPCLSARSFLRMVGMGFALLYGGNVYSQDGRFPEGGHPLYRFDLTDEEWERLAPFFPDRYHQDNAGHPWKDHRPLVNGILWHLPTHVPHPWVQVGDGKHTPICEQGEER